jgi:hypothetical protein
MAPDRSEQRLELGEQPPTRLGVAVALVQVDVPAAVDRDALSG